MGGRGFDVQICVQLAVQTHCDSGVQHGDGHFGILKGKFESRMTGVKVFDKVL